MCCFDSDGALCAYQDYGEYGVVYIDAYFAGQFVTNVITCLTDNMGNGGEDNSLGVVSDTFLKTTQIYNIDLED